MGNTGYSRGKHEGYIRDTHGTHIISQINPIWVPCLTHFHFLSGSYVVTPYETHIDAQMTPIWVPYTCAVWAASAIGTKAPTLKFDIKSRRASQDFYFAGGD